MKKELKGRTWVWGPNGEVRRGAVLTVRQEKYYVLKLACVVDVSMLTFARNPIRVVEAYSAIDTHLWCCQRHCERDIPSAFASPSRPVTTGHHTRCRPA